jgi:hypothetical protein
MRLHDCGVGHLSTHYCKNALLQDRHTLLHDNVDVSTPESMDEEVMISHDSDGEGDLEDDEGAVDILEGDLGDEDLISAAGFSILLSTENFIWLVSCNHVPPRMSAVSDHTVLTP